MAGFTSLDDLLSELTVNGKELEAVFRKNNAVAVASPQISLWKAEGFPAAGADPATTPGTAYTSTDGGLAAWADQDPDQKHLLQIECTCTIQGTLILYDRLVGVSGISLASTGNKTISSDALPRYTDGVGVQAFLEVTTATTTTAPIVSMNSYTDQAGNTGAAGPTLTFPAAATAVNALVGPLPFAAGDYGVQAISTINVATAAATGVVNVVLLRPIAILPVGSLSGNVIDYLTELPRIYDGATLMLGWENGVGGTPAIFSLWGSLYGVYG